MEDAPDGEITNGTHISDLKEGDSVLCRTNAPLMKVYVDLLKDKKEAYILGKDIGDNMIKAIKHFDVDVINQNMHSDGLFLQLYQDLFYTRDKIMRQAGIDKITASNSDEIVKKYDMIQCISILSDGINSVDVLINKIKSIFSDKDRKGIKLSTIHKAKGLTLDNVYVCCPSLIPSSRAVQKWEIDQEHNLEYVCYTRARKKLSFMSEEGRKLS